MKQRGKELYDETGIRQCFWPAQGIRQGGLLEVTLDISYKYMENAITVNSQGGIENVATPAADTVASIVMNRQSAISLRNLLIQTLGAE